jgi:hypothetical protein
MKIKSRTVRASLFKKSLKLGWKNLWKCKGRINNLRREPLDCSGEYHNKMQSTKFKNGE